MSEQPNSLIRKLAEVMAEVERIPKHGHNAHFGYDYATEADITAEIRQKLAVRHVIVLPGVTALKREGTLTTLEMVFTFYDGETGEALATTWAGVGDDKSDKGVWKAMTGAVKYLLLKTFLIPTGDDPEADGAQPQRQPAKREASPARPLPNPQPPQRQQPAQSTESSGLYVVEARRATSGTNNKGPWTLHVLKFSDQREGKTFSTSVYSTALRAHKDRLPVEVAMNAKGDITKLDLVFQRQEAVN